MASESDIASEIGNVNLDKSSSGDPMEFENELGNYSDISDIDGDNPVSDIEEIIPIEKIEDEDDQDADFIPKFDLNDISGQISFRNNRQQKHRREARDFLVERYASLSDFREHLKVSEHMSNYLQIYIFFFTKRWGYPHHINK